MIVRKIRPDELKRTKELFSIAFEFAYECDKDAMEVYETCIKEPKTREDASPLEKYGAFLDDNQTMTSCLSAIRYPMNFDGHSVVMAGIGGVSSLPQHRKGGGIRGCFVTMLPELYKEEVAFSCLYPFSTAYYRKFGYEVGTAMRMYEWKLAYLPEEKPEGHCELLDATNREKSAKGIQKVYRTWQKKYNGMIENESYEYAFVTEADPYRTQEFTYIYYKKNKEAAAYMTFRKEKDATGQRLDCSRFVFEDMEGLKGLLALAKTFSSDHYEIRFTLPEDCRIEPLMQERSFGACQIKESYLGMVRVIHVEKVLKMARYRGSGAIAIEIEDADILENNGVFEVIFAEGKAVSVMKKQMLPQITMSIAEFSRWIIGAAEESSLAYCSHIKIQQAGLVESGLFGKVFYKKPCYLMEYF